MASADVDYYAVLGVTSTSTAQQIRDAYKRAALKSHPDRVAADSPDREKRTKEFQRVNDAYYTLSDPTRRRDYDEARRYHHATAEDYDEDDEEYEEEIPAGGSKPSTAGGGGSFPWSSFGFGSKKKNDPGHQQGEPEMANEQFASVFEEMMREEGLGEQDPEHPNVTKPTGKFWGILGGLSGGVMGFIVANVPGAMAGAVAGNRLGAIRDTRGKSVYAVFQELPQADKAKFLSELATKVFATAISG